MVGNRNSYGRRSTQSEPTRKNRNLWLLKNPNSSRLKIKAVLKVVSWNPGAGRFPEQLWKKILREETIVPFTNEGTNPVSGTHCHEAALRSRIMRTFQVTRILVTEWLRGMNILMPQFLKQSRRQETELMDHQPDPICQVREQEIRGHLTKL